MWKSNTRRRSLVHTLGFAAACALTCFASDATAQATDYHVVNEGDTLYDLSGSYFGDVYQWPRMWAYNAHITNPHWIYPGDIIYLKAPTAAPIGGDQQIVVQPDAGMNLPVAGFVTNDKLEYAGRIIASPKQASMLSPLDKAWVGFGDEAYSDEEKGELEKEDQREMRASEPKEGDLYAIVREAGQIEDSEGEKVGQKYLVLGALKITEVSDKYYDTAEIVQAWREIERGDYLIPYERQLKVVEAVKSDKDMVAEISDGIEALNFYGEFHYVFVNKGAEDGVRPGNRFFAYQRSEGLDFGAQASDDKVPWSRIGQVMVLDVREAYSLAIVTDSAQELRIGDRLEMYEGY